MNLLNHITAQIFVTAAGLAAFVHSTWSLATFFTGQEPDKRADIFAWVLWIVPAALIAFAIDVGQINTAHEIRSGQRTIKKYITFTVFAVATYYLQWLYIVHHMPEIALASGITAEAQSLVMAIRNAAIWILPALLPLSTLLYTLSHSEVKTAPFAETSAPSTPLQTSSAPGQSRSVLARLKSSVNVAANGHSHEEAVPPADSSKPSVE